MDVNKLIATVPTPVPVMPAQPASATPSQQTNSGTQASQLNSLLQALAGLLEQIKQEDGAQAAASDLQALLNDSRLEIQELLDTSLAAQQAFHELKLAFAEAFKDAPADDAEAQASRDALAQAMKRIETLYVERNRRRLEQDWDFLWRWIYLEPRRRAELADDEAELSVLVSPSALSSPAALSRALADQDTSAGSVGEMLQLLSQSRQPSEQALLLDEAYHRLFGQVLQSPPTPASLQQADAVHEVLSELLNGLLKS